MNFYGKVHAIITTLETLSREERKAREDLLPPGVDTRQSSVMDATIHSLEESRDILEAMMIRAGGDTGS